MLDNILTLSVQVNKIDTGLCNSVRVFPSPNSHHMYTFNQFYFNRVAIFFAQLKDAQRLAGMSRLTSTIKNLALFIFLISILLPILFIEPPANFKWKLISKNTRYQPPPNK